MSIHRLALAVFMPTALLAAGCAVDQQYSQAQLDAIQTREYDTSVERTYLAVVSVMLEQGYQITESDLEGGLLVGIVTRGDTWGGYWSDMIQIAVLDAPRSTATVRISTSSGGQTRVDEALTRRLHQRIDVHAHTPPAELVWEPAS